MGTATLGTAFLDTALWALLGGVAALLLVLLGAALALGLAGRPVRSRERAVLDAARADVEALRARVEELSAELAASRTGGTDAAASRTGGTGPSEYVITTAGDRPPLSQVPDRAVLSATVGELLVKAAAFGYALRRALSPESRNRIAFEMRREVRRARKARRRAGRRTSLATTSAEETAA